MNDNCRTCMGLTVSMLGMPHVPLELGFDTGVFGRFDLSALCAATFTVFDR